MEGAPEGKKRPGISRRDLFRVSVGGFAAAHIGVSSAASGEVESSRELTANTQERDRSVTTIETPSATYKIEYTNHTRISSPHTAEGVDAVILECITPYALYQDERLATVLIDELRGRKKGGFDVYKEVIEAAFANKIPVFIADSANDVRAAEAMANIDTNTRIRQAESIAALGVAMTISSNPKEGKEVLMNTGKGILAAGLLSPAVEDLAQATSTGLHSSSPNENTLSRRAKKVLSTTNEAIHPELRTWELHYRNKLIAYKSQMISDVLRKQLGRKPTIAIEIGSAHSGIENELRQAPADLYKKMVKVVSPQEFANDSMVLRYDLIDGAADVKVTTLYDDNFDLP